LLLDQSIETDPMDCDEQDNRIAVNSMLLSGHSPFFRPLFTHGFREKDQTEVEIAVQPQDRDTSRTLIKFLYSDGAKFF